MSLPAVLQLVLSAYWRRFWQQRFVWDFDHTVYHTCKLVMFMLWASSKLSAKERK